MHVLSRSESNPETSSKNTRVGRSTQGSLGALKVLITSDVLVSTRSSLAEEARPNRQTSHDIIGIRPWNAGRLLVHMRSLASSRMSGFGDVRVSCL